MPWRGGDKGNGGGPWGGGDGPWGKGSNGGGPRPPDLDALLSRLKSWLRNAGPGGGSTGIVAGVIAALVVLAWLATGFYVVQPDQQGVVLRFGAYRETTQPGLHYHWPIPIETALVPLVTRVQRTEVGSIDAPGRPGQRDQRPDEALMLTGDENIVDINISAFWTVSDARAFLFNIRDPDLTVKSATESAVREVVGRMPIASVLAEGRHQVETDTQALLQQILDTYGAGILVGQVQLQKADPPAQVIEAFRDVQRAHTDADSLRNKAEAYANDVVPRARGEAAQISQEAEGYKTAMVAQATGNAERFSEVYKAYRLAKDVTAERMYLETVEEVLKGANKVLVDHATAGVLPWLALPNGSGSDGNPPPLPGAAKGAK